jgi:hypothetical protein
MISDDDIEDEEKERSWKFGGAVLSGLAVGGFGRGWVVWYIWVYKRTAELSSLP